MSDEIESNRAAAEAHGDSAPCVDDRISPGVPAASVSAGKSADSENQASSLMPSETDPAAKRTDRSRLYGILSVAFALIAAVAILAGAGYGAGFFGGDSPAAQGNQASVSSQAGQEASQQADQPKAASSSSASATADSPSPAINPVQNAGDSASASQQSGPDAAPNASTPAASEISSSTTESASETTDSTTPEPATAAPAELVDVPDKTLSSDTVQTDENNKIKVTVSVDSSRIAAYGIDPFQVEQVVELDPGASVYDALCALGLPISGTSYYVSAINGLAERQGGQGSGWTYSVDGAFPSKSCGKYLLYGGEKVAWIYSTEKEPTLVMK